jgi:hypothetical protein
MRVHNFTFKGLSFWDSYAKTNNFAVQTVNYGLNLLTQVYEKTTGHGAYSTNTLAWGRMITISWVIFWSTRAERRNAQQKLQAIIKPEYYLEGATRWFYEYTFTNDNGDVLKWQAKVYSDIRYEDSVDSPIVPFSFDILSDNPAIQWYTQKTASGFDWFIGWTKLGCTLWVKLNEVIGELTITNNGNWIAPVKIQVTWSLTNPIIKNLTNYRQYGLDKTTADLIFDNTWENLIVTDEWVNVKWLRKAWSKLIYLDPWVNKLILLADNDYVSSQVTFSVLWNDTYIN